MRALIAFGIFVFAFTAMHTSANAGFGAGGLVGACKSQCNIIGTGRFQSLKPNEQVCVNKCVAARKAAQH
jgi:hypothetical protein